LANRARKLASLTAAGAGAIALTSGTASASIIVSPTLNNTYSFIGNATPNTFHVISHQVAIMASGPRFSVDLYSNNGSITFNRFANLYHGARSTQFVNPAHGRVAVGKNWNQVVTGAGTYARIADRSWGGSHTTLKGMPAGSGFYELFRFQFGGQTKYGWVEYNVAVTNANSPLASDGPNITIVKYAWQSTGNTVIAAGDVGGAAVPEPGAFAESALGILMLGAVGIRRWRKSKQLA
jgi:hypothetical protein